MRAVLYTHDMEPITVLDVPPKWQAYMMETGSICLAVIPPLTLEPFDKNTDVTQMICQTYTVRITVERLVRRDKTHVMLFTQDEEAAMLLRSTFLPGQQTEVHRIKQKEFAKGFFSALRL